MKTYRKILIALLMAICAISCAFAVACINTEEPPEPELQTLATPQNLQVVYNLKADNTIVYELVWDVVENASGYEVKISDNKIDAYQAKLDISKYVAAGRTYAIRVTAKGDERKNYTDSEMAVLSNKIEELTKGVEYSLLDDGTYKATAVNASISAITGRVVLPDKYNGAIISTLAEASFQRSELAINGGSAKNNEYTTSVRLPANLKVVEKSAFGGCRQIEEMILPDTVTTIGESAFSGCFNLTKINMPKSLTQLGNNCFFNNNLKNIELPEGLISIGSMAFASCNLLNISSIPQSVESIGSYALEGTVYYNDESNWNNEGALYISNCLISVKTDAAGLFKVKEGTKVIASHAFSKCKQLTEIVVPNGIKKIGDYLFQSCSSVTSITIPESVTSIDDNAFIGCHSLVNIVITESVTSIGSFAFQGCKSFVNITIPESVTSLAEGIFLNCQSLESITIPESVTEIGKSAFNSCTALKSIKIPEKVTSIELDTFKDCENLKEITLSKNITTIRRAFSNCISLERINYDGTMAEWLAIHKFYGWNYNTGDYTVICADGKLDKEGNIRS